MKKTPAKTTAKAAPLKRAVVHELAVGALTPDPNQPRKAFDEKALQALADSIGERGILQPILVRQDGNRVVIVDGERRWRAAKLAKLKVVPALLADLDEDDVTTKVPRRDREDTVFFPLADGSLSRQDPRQRDLDLKGVDTATGEITDHQRSA